MSKAVWTPKNLSPSTKVLCTQCIWHVKEAEKHTEKVLCRKEIENLQYFHVKPPPQKPLSLLPANQQGGDVYSVSLHTLSLRQFVNHKLLLVPNYS